MSELQSIGKGLVRLEGFFGKPASAVDLLCLRIALRHNFPAWLKKRPLAKQLPRRKYGGFSQAPVGRLFETKIRKLDEEADLIVWVVENTNGPWDILPGCKLWLSSDTDAVLYRLRWA